MSEVFIVNKTVERHKSGFYYFRTQPQIPNIQTNLGDITASTIFTVGRGRYALTNDVTSLPGRFTTASIHRDMTSDLWIDPATHIDANLMKRRGYLFLMADGAADDSYWVARYLLDSIQNKYYDPMTTQLEPAKHLESCIRQANNEVILETNVRSLKNLATTLAAFLIKDDGMYFTTVGDTRIFCRFDDGWEQISKDDLVTSEMVNSSNGKLSHKDIGNTLTRYLGDKSFNYRNFSIQVTKLDRAPQEVILATDWIESQHLLTLLNSGFIKKISILVDAVYRNQGLDNTSLLHLKIE